MGTGFRGTFVIAWSQTETDGENAASVGELGIGSTWRWSGDIVRIDSQSGILRLDGASGDAAMRKRAAQTVRKLVGAATTRQTDLDAIQVDDPLGEQCFTVTDGRAAYVVTIIDVAGTRPLAMFVDQVPPADTDLWVVAGSLGAQRQASTGAGDGHVICFTPGTRIRQAEGSCDVADLRAGDWIQTKDNGLQQVLWCGQRRITGARLHVMPHLAPVRIRAGALGVGRPDQELLVSPEHRMLVKGAQAQALFNCDEVLVGARDLVNGSDVIIDRMVRSVSYVHVLLGSHEIVWANGLETESFHPAQAALSEAQYAELATGLGVKDGQLGYGAFARRVLSPSEAAILGHAA
ncbi:MAG: Hint domain-containing protein [Pseudomonadota bacterium]